MLKVTTVTDRHEASRGLFATAELLHCSLLNTIQFTCVPNVHIQVFYSNFYIIGVCSNFINKCLQQPNWTNKTLACILKPYTQDNRQDLASKRWPSSTARLLLSYTKCCHLPAIIWAAMMCSLLPMYDRGRICLYLYVHTNATWGACNQQSAEQPNACSILQRIRLSNGLMQLMLC